MATALKAIVPGFQFEATPNLSRLETRERLSHSAIEGYFKILEKWSISIEQGGELMGGKPRSTMYKLKSGGILSQDELTRISYVVGIYKALHILFPEDLADQWVTRPNDNALFGGQAPFDFMIREGIPGLQKVRSLLDSARGGH